MDTFSWLTTLSVWLAFGMTSFLVTSRVALLWLLRLYKYEQVHPATWYIIVIVLLQIPHLSNLVHLLWNTPFISTTNREALPKAAHVSLGVLASILEAVVTSLFATEIAHVLPEPVLLTLPYSTLVFVIFKDILHGSRKHSKKMSVDISVTHCLLGVVSKCVNILIVCFFFSAATVIGTILCGWTEFRLSVGTSIMLSAAVLLLSSTWSPAVQRLILLSRKTRRRCATVDLLYIPVKMTSVTVTVFLSLYFRLEDFRILVIECLDLAFREFSDVRVWLPVVICCISAFWALMSAAAASKVCLMKPGMKIPMFLCPALAILVTIVLWNDIETRAFWELAGDDVYSWTAIGLSALTWFIPFFHPSFRGFLDNKIINKDINESFYSFSWNPFFLEPKMILSYDARSVSEKWHQSVSVVNSSLLKKRTVFICTTMYKENEKEMKRYLRSVKSVFADNNKDTLDIEAHIFFDSSVHKDRINYKGQTLLTLLCDTFQIDKSDMDMMVTPYGCQVHTKTRLNYSVYIHFKDSTKVKAKKRWSQVMYMHYVLEFRNLRLNESMKQKQLPATSEKLRQYQENAFRFDNRINFRHSSMTNICSREASNSYTKLSEASSCDISFLPMKKQSLITEHLYDIKGGKCYCYSDNSSIDGFPSQNIDDNSNRQNKATPLLDCLCQPASSFVLPNCHLWLVTDTDRRLPGYSRSVPSTETSEKDCSSSSDVENLVSLDESSSREWSKYERDSIASLDDVYLLTTDADTEFSIKSIQHLLEKFELEPGLGAVCGRTVPIGLAKPIVWYQKFEYAKDFWLVKSSQNVIGSVTCCPGCFSLYRGSAVASIVEKFSQPTCSAFDNLVMDHGEDRWLCTLLMQRGWRLAYSSHAHNSTHCPETMGEFLRQRRRWVLSELSNMTAIFMSVPSLVRNNPCFSGMFLISLFTTFLWVVLSPSTTLVFICAGLEVLFSISMTTTLPIAMPLFVGYSTLCCVASQKKQKLLSLTVIFVMALTVMALGVGFILYVVLAVRRDIQIWGSLQFQPCFLVFLLVSAIVYAALLHPKETPSLVYGLAYSLLFPAIFIVLPGYALSNMLDQSWGTRETKRFDRFDKNTQIIDQNGVSEVRLPTTLFFRRRIHDAIPSSEILRKSKGNLDPRARTPKQSQISIGVDLMTVVSNLPSLASYDGGKGEENFWKQLVVKHVGKDVNNGKSDVVLNHELRRLRRWVVTSFVVVNLIWFTCLSALYACVGSDVICYCVAAIFSFSLFVQLVGLTCYKCHVFLSHYLVIRSRVFVTRASKQ